MDVNKKFFDVSKPNKIGPSPTSKPIIVGHHPTMPDPMIAQERDNSPKPINIDVQDGDTPAKSEVIEPKPEVMPPTPRVEEPTPVIEPIEPETPAAVTEPVQEVSDLPPTAKPAEPESSSDEVHVPAGHVAHGHKPRIWVWGIVAVLVLALIYAAVDAKTDILPFHIFSHNATVNVQQNSQTNNTAPPPASSTQSALPSGFSNYQPTGTPIIYAYPAAWGTPTTTNDPGYSQRGKAKAADGFHAYITRFSKNKDVEVVITSAKYLPPARATLYYDYLQWCNGSNDTTKFYKSSLLFTSSGGVDTPSTITCDTGPLTDATAISNAIILQHQTKDASGALLGDVYTANINDKTYSVLRVKDTKMTNGNDIKTLLNNISGASSSSQ